MVLSENIADALNKFTKREAADLVIVNPGSQTEMPGLLSNIFGNIFQKYASPPVLAITALS